jgi:PrtD family type I secretion system ABC transporter
VRASDHQGSATSPIAIGLSACSGAFVAIGVLTALINVLMLTGSLFMLQVYDRVLPSRSVPTLLALGAMAIGLFAFQGFLDACRGRILVRIGSFLNERLNGRIYDALAKLPLRIQGKADGVQPLRDLDQIQGFLSGLGPTALFDLPWMPLYLGICFVFHAWIGITAMAGAAILVSLTLWTEALTRAPTRAMAEANARRHGLAEATRRNAEVLQAMGMRGRLAEAWAAANASYRGASQRAADVSGGLGATSRVLRMMLQSTVLAVGAYLAINQEATGGIIIASSILVSRALAPVELAIANWKGFVAARQSRKRLTELLKLMEQQAPALTALPPPAKSLAVEGLNIAPPGQVKLVVQDASFTLVAGQALGVIGPSASGKSSLARGIAGVWLPARGKVRLDGASLEQWPGESLGPHIGYLPQDIELLDGTVSENISRFSADVESDAVIGAARAAGVHDLIVHLPDGYATRVGEGGLAISAGQRQRIALARALYRDPFLVVLDEPNSNLDAEGDEALTRAILAARARGAVVIVIAHRPSALLGVDLILAMANGRVHAFGPKEEVLQKVLDRSKTHLRPVKLAADSEAKS